MEEKNVLLLEQQAHLSQVEGECQLYREMTADAKATPGTSQCITVLTLRSKFTTPAMLRNHTTVFSDATQVRNLRSSLRGAVTAGQLSDR